MTPKYEAHEDNSQNWFKTLIHKNDYDNMEIKIQR